MTLGSTSNGKPTLNGQIFNHGTTGVRQTVQSGSVDTNGYANFISIGTGLSINLAATTVPLNIHSAGGSIPNDRLGIILTDTTLALPASQTNFIIATIDSLGVVTLSSVILPIVYQFGGTPSIVANQYTFNIGEMKMYLGNGSTASQVWAVCIGEAITSGTAVTSVVSYALNGMYDSSFTATIPNTLISLNSNMGIVPKRTFYIIECTTTDLGYAVGDTLINACTYGNVNFVSIVPFATRNTLQLPARANSPYISPKSSAGAVALLTSASWKYKLAAERGW